MGFRTDRSVIEKAQERGFKVTKRTVSGVLSATHEITGNLYVSGALYANEYHVDTITTTVSNIEQYGSTLFGNSADDTHQFTGSFYITNDASFGSNLSIAGNILPDGNQRSLGASNGKWEAIYTNNLYTGDLHMKNDRGDWTIIEEEAYLSVINNKTGKVYKMVLEEVK